MAPSRILYYYVSPSLAILALLLNSILVYTLARQYRRNKRGSERKHSIPLIFLANLAISDLLVGLTVAVTKVIYFLYYHKLIQWSLPLGWAFHIMKFAFLRLSLLTSVFNLASLTIDRFLAISYPMVYRIKVNNTHALVVVCITWLLSAIFTTVHYSISNFSGIALWRYDLVIFPAVVFPAALVFGICYSLILLTIRRQGRKMRLIMSYCCTTEEMCNRARNLKIENRTCDANAMTSNSEVDNGSCKGVGSCANLSGSNKVDMRGNSGIVSSEIGINNNTSVNTSESKIYQVKGVSNCLSANGTNQSVNREFVTRNSPKNVPFHVQKREIKIYRFVGTVVGVFLLCWLPIAICGVIFMKRNVDKLLVNSVFTLAFANSAIDPIVYFVFNDKVSRKIGAIFRLLCRCTRVREEQRFRRGSHLFSSTSEGSNTMLSKTRSIASVASAETNL